MWCGGWISAKRVFDGGGIVMMLERRRMGFWMGCEWLWVEEMMTMEAVFGE